MAKKIYKRIGIRRDRNLADLSDRKQGLNNLLDALVDGTSTFISEDLDVIRNIYTEGLSAGQYQKIIGSKTSTTNSVGNSVDILPPITYQNKLDKFQFFAGEPRLNGGNGLTAKYYDQENIDISTTNIFSGTPIKTDNFWEAGNFNYTGKITPLANNSNGGIEWDGFFIPTITGPYTFYYSTTASFTFEFEDIAESGTVTERMRVGTTPITSDDYPGIVVFGGKFTSSASGVGNEITLATAGNSIKVGAGMSVSGTNIVKDSKVFSVNPTSGVITLVHPDVTEPATTTPAVTGAISSQNITFYRNTGVTVSKNYTTPTLVAFQKYRIKYRYFIPRYQDSGGTFIAIDSSSLDRNADMNFLLPGGGNSTNLRFENLYSTDYDFSDAAKGTFPTFVDNSILFGGGTIGSPTDSSDYVKVKSTKKVDVRYAPPTSLSQIVRATQTCDLTNGSSIISIPSTTGIEVGNYVFGTNIPTDTRVNEIVLNKFIILSKNVTGGGSPSLTFIDHRGFVKRVSGSASADDGSTPANSILTISASGGDTTNLKTGMIVIASGIQQYTGITTNHSSLTDSDKQVKIFPRQGLANRSFYFYESKGLRNDSLLRFCEPTEAQCMIIDGAVPAGSSTITVDSIPPNVQTDWTIRGFQFSDRNINGNFDPTKITITPGSNQITLSRATINPLVNGEKVSVSPSNAGDRTLCCPPVDTSPPFQATEDGLQTTAQFPNLKLSSGDIKFDNLTVIKDITIDDVGASANTTKYLDLSTPSGNFKILCE